ncbi:hypothetical protein ACJMK2_005479 [Sinanodonta woodiana]|uniref:Uncharacterized protein n=1 Tax=Sinanodonta woodiana TaxID=1069815 RepID=A0ABD3VTP1_SINWO
MLISSETRLPAYGTSKNRPISLRSAPVLAWQESEIHVELGNHDYDNNSASDRSISDHGHNSEVYHSNHVTANQTQTRNKMDPLRLSEYLKEHGFGYPLLLTSSHKQRRMSAVLPPGFRARKLPSNPSKREKIKGRARLDQEIANMRAMAFCEQQTPKVFRTASANMENRDVQFVEDEMREQMHTDEMIEDDTGSVTMMPVRKDELFKRIDTWLDGVCDAFRTNTSKESIEKQG